MASRKRDRTISRNRRRAWYFAQQRGLCCLQITDGCTARGGLMSLDVDPFAANYATFEHLTPRTTLRKKKAANHDVACVQLLACRACNNGKGAHAANEAMIAVAALFFQRWRVEALDLALQAKRAEEPAVADALRRSA